MTLERLRDFAGGVIPATWVVASLAACTPQGAPVIGDEGYEDRFDRATLGEMYKNTGGSYEIRDGQLHVRAARNKPLWLRRRLPRDVRIEFDVRSESPEGDIKVEVFGDGSSKAESTSYTATSYVLIFGGWGNSKNMIARLDEHGSDGAEGPRFPVEQGKTYRIKIERRGSVITAWADGHMLASLNDPSPLVGRGHEYFAFNNWQSDLWFDNLVISPLR